MPRAKEIDQLLWCLTWLCAISVCRWQRSEQSKVHSKNPDLGQADPRPGMLSHPLQISLLGKRSLLLRAHDLSSDYQRQWTQCPVVQLHYWSPTPKIWKESIAAHPHIRTKKRNFYHSNTHPNVSAHASGIEGSFINGLAKRPVFHVLSLSQSLV